MKAYITAIGTANPENCFQQSEIGDFMASALDLQREESIKLRALYKATGIKQRFSVIKDFGLRPEEFKFFPKNKNLEPFPSIRDRMVIYEKEALPLAIKAIKNSFKKSRSIGPSDITHLITVSCTGMYAPGLDIEIVQEMGLQESVQRTCINYMGCYAAFNALKTADVICRADKNSKVLIVCVEICSIHFQKKKDWDHILSNALFSDGAAAVIVQAEPKEEVCLSLDSFFCGLAPKGKNDMAWHIGDHGFEMTLSSYVPGLIKEGISALTNKLLAQVSTMSDQIDYYAIHPGGKKILEVIEEELGLTKEDNQHAYNVLRDYGNMSSATVLFVLKDLMQKMNTSEDKKNVLSFAFGPGLTLESLLLQVHCTSAKITEDKNPFENVQESVI